MTNSLALEIAMKERGITKRELAKSLGLSEMGLYKKIRNDSEFKASEISAITNILELPLESRDKIFFAE